MFLALLIVPLSGVFLPIIKSIRVDFPSPLEPTSPTFSPSFKLKEASLRMMRPPKSSVNFSIDIKDILMHLLS